MCQTRRRYVYTLLIVNRLHQFLFSPRQSLFCFYFRLDLRESGLRVHDGGWLRINEYNVTTNIWEGEA